MTGVTEVDTVQQNVQDVTEKLKKAKSESMAEANGVNGGGKKTGLFICVILYIRPLGLLKI